MQEKDHKTNAQTVVNCFDAMPIGFFCFYLKYISRDWFPINLGFLLLGWASLISAYFIEESPEWLMN
jgi:hypothetical protein